ncbi:hypothetical protein MD537_19850, partial [Flavihumibacter sediminis]|nr:hypothetical protein [Flavihumibacter sediminis]
FLLQLKISESESISVESFLAALEEASRILIQNLETIRKQLYLDGYRRRFESRLSQVGFTNRSLRLKAATLNFHWRRVRRRVGDAVDSIIDFSNNPIVRVLRRFLEYLNSILGSLTKVIPGVEAIKEIKEI